MKTYFKTLFAALAIFASAASLAALGDPFELDANALKDSPVPSQDDWDRVFAGTGNSLASTFVKDENSPDHSVHQPSNKDIKGLSSMGCISKKNVTDKLGLRASYSATYLNSNNIS